jgi:hypothetical protein
MKHNDARPNLYFNPHHDPLPTAVAHLWSHMVRFEEAWHLVQAIRDWPGVMIAPDRHGLRIALHGVMLGHLGWNGRLALPFGPEIGDRLVAEGMVSRNPDQRDMGRVVFQIRAQADVDHAVWLLRLAFLTLDSKRQPRLTSYTSPLPSDDDRGQKETHA